MICPACAQQTADAGYCVHCGAPLAPRSRKLLSSEMPGADYGVFLLSAPIIAVVGLLIVALAAHSVSGFIWLLVLTALCTALLAAAEIFQAPAAWSSGSPLRPMFGWLGLVALLWPVGFPAYLRGRQRFRLGNWLAGAILVEIIFIAGAALALVITVSGYGKAPPQTAAQTGQDVVFLTADPHWAPDPDDIQVVQTGHLDNCPGKTVAQEVDGFFATPRWEAGATATGTDFVNIRGILTYQGKPMEAVLQFVMYKDKSGFKYQAFTIGGVPQSLYVAAFTMAQMCA